MSHLADTAQRVFHQSDPFTKQTPRQLVPFTLVEATGRGCSRATRATTDADSRAHLYGHSRTNCDTYDHADGDSDTDAYRYGNAPSDPYADAD
jgi:hypothetical protein